MEGHCLCPSLPSVFTHQLTSPYRRKQAVLLHFGIHGGWIPTLASGFHPEPPPEPQQGLVRDFQFQYQEEIADWLTLVRYLSLIQLSVAKGGSSCSCQPDTIFCWWSQAGLGRWALPRMGEGKCYWDSGTSFLEMSKSGIRASPGLWTWRLSCQPGIHLGSL